MDHRVGQLAVQVALHDSDLAHALRPQLEALAWRILPAVMQRVFDSLAPADDHLVIDRLDLDLGNLRPAFLESDAIAALELALAEAIGAAVHAARQAPGEQGRLVRPAAWQRQQLATYLATGTLPDRRAGAPFDMATSLWAALADDPGAVAALLRQASRNGQALDRLVLQLDDAGLARLLAALAPADADVILGLIGETRLLHRLSAARPLRRVTATALHQLLWVTTFDFLLNDAGSQFNRRRYLERLLARAADQMAIPLGQLLLLLAQALAIARDRTALRSSLPRTLAELLAEQGGQSMDALAAPDAAGPIALAGREAVAEQPVAALSDAEFAALVRQLAPGGEPVISDNIALLLAAWQRQSSLPAPPGGLQAALRRLVLSHLGAAGGNGLDAAGLWTAICTLVAGHQPDRAAQLAWQDRRLPLQIRTALLALARPTTPGAFARWQQRLASAVAAGDHAAVLAAVAAVADAGWSQLLTAELQALLVARLPEPVFAQLLDQLAGARRQHGAARRAGPKRPALHPAARRGRQLAALIADAPGRPTGEAMAAAGQTAAQGWTPRPAEAVAADLAASAAGPQVDFALTGPELAALDAYLGGEGGDDAGALLPRLASTDPQQLVGLARRLAATADAAVVARRLLGWLLPDELLALFAADRAAALAAAAPRSGPDADWWCAAVAALLTDQPLPPAAAPPADRLAAVASWLDGGAASPAAAARLMALSPAERRAVLAGCSEADALARLGRAAHHLDHAAMAALLREIAPWVADDRLAPLLAAHGAEHRALIQLRAAAAALSGTTVDLAALATGLGLADAAAGRAHETDDGQDRLTSLLAWLDGRATPPDAAALERQLLRRLEAGDRRLLAWLQARKGQARQRERWAAILPDAALVRVLDMLAPRVAQALHDGLRLLISAANQVLPFGSARPEPRALWQMLLDGVATSVTVDVPGLLGDLASRVVGDDPRLVERVRAQALRRATDAGQVRVAAALRRGQPAARPSPPPPPSPTANRNPAFTLPKATAAAERPYYVANAGLVLLHPFIPTLFERLDLLISDANGRQRLASEAAASRACHLLQYLIDGRLDAPEPDLVLNKLLCGLPLGVPVARRLEPEPGDLALCDDLLAAVIGNWPALSNTSVAGLQESFLQREGRLQRGNGQWTLQVQRRTLDVLMSQVPWGISIVYCRWMPEPLHVTW